MIDTYLKSTSKDSLSALAAFAVNVMVPPTQGKAATPYSVDDDGNITEAQDAVGDPDYWYTCVRFLLPIGASGDIELCDEDEGILVCGEWA